jgi:hypothetical protein
MDFPDSTEKIHLNQSNPFNLHPIPSYRTAKKRISVYLYENSHCAALVTFSPTQAQNQPSHLPLPHGSKPFCFPATGQ